MELPGITVGGGIQGGAGESSSFKYGCFNEICNWYEMILADGRIMTVSRTSHSDLFYETAGSYGSLGVLTAAEIQCIPAKKYVAVTYISVGGFADMVAGVNKWAHEEDVAFIDGIQFGKNSGFVIIGRLSDKKVGRVTRFSRARDNWFYIHAEKLRGAHQEITESVPLTDYLFRYDRGAFWTGRFPFERAGLPFNRFTRAVLNPILSTRKLYQALQESGAAQQHIVQDLAVPIAAAPAFMQFIDTTIGSYPLWVCPIKPSKHSQFQCNNLDTPLAINIGVWSNTRITPFDTFVTLNRNIESKLQKVGGKKWFYAHSYYQPKEFWAIYNKQSYDALRQKYNAITLPNIYDKIRVRHEPKVNIKKAAFKTLFGKAALRIKP
jgi:FAD/FMN-containing dehydrogenase